MSANVGKQFWTRMRGGRLSVAGEWDQIVWRAAQSGGRKVAARAGLVGGTRPNLLCRSSDRTTEADATTSSSRAAGHVLRKTESLEAKRRSHRKARSHRHSPCTTLPALSPLTPNRSHNPPPAHSPHGRSGPQRSPPPHTLHMLTTSSLCGSGDDGVGGRE